MMRYLSMTEDEADRVHDVAVLLQKAIENSTGTPGQMSGSAPGPIVPSQTAFERIIAKAELPPPAGGWPPYDPDQSSATHKDTDYVHTNTWGGPNGGYYSFPGLAERNYRPMPVPDVSDMVPGHWSQAHIIAAIMNSGGLNYSPGGAGLVAWTALHGATGEGIPAGGTAPGAAKALSDTQGSKFATALANIRAGATVEAAFAGMAPADFSVEELAGAWALAQSYGVR